MVSSTLADVWLKLEEAIGQRPQLTGDALAMRAQYKAVNDEANANLVRSNKVVIEDKLIDGNLPVRIYKHTDHIDAAKGSHLFPVGLYFHGGGFCCGDLDSEEKFCLVLAERRSCVIVSVGYRLAPEHKAPAQLDDAMRAWTWAYNNATDLKGDRDNYFTIGQSAGGSLALSVVRRLVALKREHEVKGIAALVPFSVHPRAVPARFSDRYQSFFELENSPVNTKEAMTIFYGK
ncbi:hypothetical protein PWT90_09067 [Aphanocladium album]|nr:hypothetical protein PWT90_09067 [Aphanocladium album]